MYLRLRAERPCISGKDRRRSLASESITLAPSPAVVRKNFFRRMREQLVTSGDVRSLAFMAAPLFVLAALRYCFFTAITVFLDLGRLVAFGLRSRCALAAENLFLRKQLAVFQERKIKPRRANDATRWMMATLSRMFQWRDVSWNVKPDTLIGWHRKGFRLFWRWKSEPTGRPQLPKELRQLIRQMAADNATWGEEYR